MYCTKCGTENDQQSVVCRACGEKIVGNTLPKEQTNPVTVDEETTVVSEVKAEPKKKKWLRAISIILSVITLLLMFGDTIKMIGEVSVWRGEEHGYDTEELVVGLSTFTMIDMTEAQMQSNDIRGIEYEEEMSDQMKFVNICMTMYKVCFAILLLAFVVMLFMMVAETKGIVISSIIFNALASLGNISLIGGITLVDIIIKAEGVEFGFTLLPIIAFVLSLVNILYVILLRKQIKR